MKQKCNRRNSNNLTTLLLLSAFPILIFEYISCMRIARFDENILPYICSNRCTYVYQYLKI